MTIKSQKAKELIEYGKFSYDEIQAYVLPESYVETIVVQAEQDAEEREEKRVFELQKLFVEVMKQKFGYRNALEVSDEVSQMIINKLNNGGQSDEK